MIVHHLENSNRRHPVQVDAPVVPTGDRIVGDLEDEPQARADFHGELLFPVALELMATPRRCRRDVAQHIERSQFRQAAPYHRAGCTPRTPQ